MLPADKRRDVELLYAWCRWCDDGVDHATCSEEAAEFIRSATDDLLRIADGRAPLAPESLWFASVARRNDLSVEAAHAVLRGMESDLLPAADLDESQLMRYCFRVAGAVGVLMCPILGLKDRRYLPHAAALGMGMQLTNIARDVAEDWGRSRCYLPLEWTSGLRPSNEAPDRERVRSGVQQALALADNYYAAGESGIDALDRGSRLAVRAASRIYHAIGSRIRQWDYCVLQERARVSFSRKVRIFLPLVFSVGRGARPETLNAAAGRALAVSERLLLEHGVTR